MRLELALNPSDLAGLESFVVAKIETARREAQAAMVDTFWMVVRANFGSAGWDRPWEWAKLSAKYAKRVGRDFATLYVTGALKDTVRKDTTSDPGSVSMGNTGGVEYALAHHFGNPGGNLPARRVFPLTESDEVTEATQAMVLAVARDAFREAMR